MAAARLDLSQVGQAARRRMTGREQRSVEIREIRRGDISSFEDVMRQGMGKLERATGLDQLSADQVRGLNRPTVWAIFRVLRVLGLAPITVLVGVDNGRVLGTASVVLLENAGYIMGVATDSRARGQGIATRLLESAVTKTKEKGRPWLALDVESDNEIAIGLYRKLGFEEKSQYGWYVGTPKNLGLVGAGDSEEASRVQLDEIATLVDLGRTQAIRDPLPASGRRLSHFEVVTRVTGAPAKTWRMSSSGQLTGAVRASYLPFVRTGFVIPSYWYPDSAEDMLFSLVRRPIDWVNTLGASRVVVIVPEPAGPWGPVVRELGMPKTVTSTLMTRRTVS